MKHNEVESSAMETLVRSKDGYLMGQQKPQDSYVSNNFGSLEDFVSVMVKQEQDKVKLPEGDLGSCGLLQSLEGNEKGHSGLVEEGRSLMPEEPFLDSASSMQPEGLE
ncbi:hypothetical protein OIU77_031472 [Salix suchowensis]|uniref:Uncharacterized protein n=1 Tax=Salix suchowensis TaxID=1278906 RepID=A0ABQ9BHS0_9ROSI|nr:hypothetical protein OIU77_031472 [Salix suchowensis]